MIDDSTSPAEALYDLELEAARAVAAARREERIVRVVLREINGKMESVLEVEGEIARPHRFFRSPLERAVYLFGKHGDAITASQRFQSDLEASRDYVDGFRAIACRDFSVWDKIHFLRSLSEKTRLLRERLGFGQQRWPPDALSGVEAKLRSYATGDRLFLIGRDLGSLGLRLAETVKAEKLARMAYCVGLVPGLLNDPVALERRQDALRVHLNRKPEAVP